MSNDLVAANIMLDFLPYNVVIKWKESFVHFL